MPYIWQWNKNTLELLGIESVANWTGNSDGFASAAQAETVRVFVVRRDEVL